MKKINPQSPHPKISEQLPDNLDTDALSMRIAKLCMLGALVWDYTDTILDIVSQQRISETKKLSRSVRQLRAAYDRNQRLKLPSELRIRQPCLAEQFEAICADHFDKFYFGVGYDPAVSQLSPGYKLLVKAVMVADTVLDALLKYAADSDKWLQRQGVTKYTVLDPRFSKLAILIPQFAGDCKDAAPKWREHTSKILLSEIKAIEFYGSNQHIKPS